MNAYESVVELLSISPEFRADNGTGWDDNLEYICNRV